MSGYHENYNEYDYYSNGNNYVDESVTGATSNSQQQQQQQYSPYTTQYQDPYDYHNTSTGGVGGGPPNGMAMAIPDVMPHLVGVEHDDEHDNHNDNNNGEEDDEDDDDTNGSDIVDFDNDPEIANLPRILMMGPRRGGKTSIQRVVFHKMSPHETLFRLEATQTLERSVVDHTPLCRFTIWDFPGDYYGPENHNHHYQQQQQQQQQQHQQQYGAGHHFPHQQQHQHLSNSPVGGSNGDGGVGPGGFQPHINDATMSNMSQQQQQQASRMMRQPPVHANNAQMQFPNYGNQFQQHNTHNDGLPSTITTTTATTAASTTGTGTENNNNDATNNNNNTNQNDPVEEEDEGDAYVFGRATALIFVLDAQDEPYDHVLQQFTETVKRAARANPHIAIEVFINKVDGELFLSDEAKYDCRRDVMQQVTDELADAGVMPDSVPISYHLTSIYDHSVFEAFSRVVQKLIPQLPTLENLLNVLVSTCAMEKAFLFDVASKLYISTDSSPVDMQSVELCSDMIDCVLDVSGIYGLAGGSADDEENENQGSEGVSGTGGRDIDSSTAPPGNELLSLNSSDPAFMKNIDSNLDDGEGGGVDAIGAGGDDFTNDIGALDYGNDGNDELVGTLISQSAGAIVDSEGKEKEVDADSAYDSESASVIRLSKGMVSIRDNCHKDIELFF